MIVRVDYCVVDGCGEPAAGSMNGLGCCLDTKHIDEVMARAFGSVRDVMRAASAARLSEATRYRGGGREE